MRVGLRVVSGVAVAAVVMGCGAGRAWAWGSDGHRMINRLAEQALPDDVPAFMRDGHALDVVEWLGPEPDRWRNRAESELVAEQAPDHFIDMEWAVFGEVPCGSARAGDSGTAGGGTARGNRTANAAGADDAANDCGADGKMLPKRRYDFIRALAAAQARHPDIQLTPEKVGMQPWEVEEIWQKLKVDLREYRKAVAANEDLSGVETAVLYDAGWLGHYVADGSQPLHVTIQYNGWTGPNPNGYTTEHKIHSQFESSYVTANIKRDEVKQLVESSAPVKIDDEWGQYLGYLKQTAADVERVYQLEKAGGFTGAGTPEAKMFTDERLAAGAIELRDLIDAAWVHSADPVEEFHGAQ